MHFQVRIGVSLHAVSYTFFLISDVTSSQLVQVQLAIPSVSVICIKPIRLARTEILLFCLRLTINLMKNSIIVTTITAHQRAIQTKLIFTLIT